MEKTVEGAKETAEASKCEAVRRMEQRPDRAEAELERIRERVEAARVELTRSPLKQGAPNGEPVDGGADLRQANHAVQPPFHREPMDFFATIQQHWLVLLIPAISSFVGWGTNWVAVKMMFYPTNFIGIPPYLGWQGIVPGGAEHLASRTTDLITNKLVNLPELFQDFAGDDFVKETAPALDEIAETIVQEVADDYAPQMWAALDESAQDNVRQMVRREVEATAVAILDEIGRRIDEVIDLKKIATEVVVRDRRLMSRMFQETGAAEFKFIEKSGAYFGFLFGILQMVVWVLWPKWLILPIAGFFVGYATNWIAIKLIFEPAEPRKLGPWTVQGLFHKRQHEVAHQFAELTSDEVLNADNVVALTMEGQTRETLLDIISKHVDALIDRYEEHPMAGMVMSGLDVDRDRIRAEIRERIVEELPKEGGFLHIFADKAVDIRDELYLRMTQLDAESFEGVLRPAFQQDEWKLIIAGAALGFGAGVLQVVYLFGEMLTNGM